MVTYLIIKTQRFIFSLFCIHYACKQKERIVTGKTDYATLNTLILAKYDIKNKQMSMNPCSVYLQRYPLS